MDSFTKNQRKKLLIRLYNQFSNKLTMIRESFTKGKINYKDMKTNEQNMFDVFQSAKDKIYNGEIQTQLEIITVFNN